MNTILAVAAGGALGSVLRHGVNHAAARWVGLAFPWGTFFENVAGCFLMGAIATWFGQRAGLGPEWRALVATGLLGGFTTFSAFTLDFAQLMGQGYVAHAALYFGATLVLAVAGFYLGAGLTKLLVT